jgi:rfaE bifunctional protein nucleotidyltransferase chain/domain
MIEPLEKLVPMLEHLRAGDNDDPGSARAIVWTNGCFDLLTPAHALFLEEARRTPTGRRNILVVGINSDDSVGRLKGPGRPIQPLKDRMLLVEHLRGVDYVISFDEDTPLEAIRKIQPDVIVKGAEYALDEVVGREVVEARGGFVHRVKMRNLGVWSTTNLIHRVRTGG